jgi:hypothetical protein
MERAAQHTHNGSGAVKTGAPNVGGGGHMFLFIYAVNGKICLGYPEMSGRGIVEKDDQ